MDRLGARERVRTIGPLALAVFGFGVSFGVLARAAGMGAVAPIVMSATTFAGSAQFAALSVAGDGGTVVAAVVAALLLNARYIPIGISVAPSVRARLWRRFVLGQLTVDESWALASRGRRTVRRPDPGARRRRRSTGWIVGTTIGVFAGSLLGTRPLRPGRRVPRPVPRPTRSPAARSPRPDGRPGRRGRWRWS